MASVPFLMQADPAEFTPIPFEYFTFLYEKNREKEKEQEALNEKAYTVESNLETEFSKIGALPVDAPERERILGDYRKQVLDIYQNNKDNPKALLNSYRELQKKFQKDLAYGKLGGIHNKYLGYTKSQKEKEELSNKYIESGGEKGLSPEDAQQYLQYELNDLNATPIQQTPYGTWETYKSETLYPTIDLNEKADSIGKEMREKPELVTQFTGLQDLGNGYFYDNKEQREVLESEAIERAVINRLSIDPLITGYVNAKNKISGKVKKLQALFAEKEAESLVNPGAYTINNVTYKPEVGKPIFEEYVADKVLNEDIYNAARTAADIYDVNRLTIDRWRGENWQARDAAKRKAEEEANVDYSSFEEGPGVTSTNLIGIPNDFFNIIPQGTRQYKFRPGIGSAYNEFIGMQEETSTTAKYTPPTKLNPKQQEGFKLLLGTVENVSPELKTISDKYKAGKQLSQEELSKVYPLMKQINERANRFKMTNANLKTITNPNELKAASLMFGMPTATGTTTVKELGGGVALNRKVFDVENNKEITYADLIEKLKKDPSAADAQISIVAKLYGPNAISAVTGNRRYAHGYQFGIGGKTYYIEGAKSYQDPRLEVPAKQNEFLSDLQKANLIPLTKLKTEHPTGLLNLEYQFVETDPNNPDAGYYKILGLDTKGKTTAASQKFAATLLDPNYNMFASPVELNAAINTYLSLLDLD